MKVAYFIAQFVMSVLLIAFCSGAPMALKHKEHTSVSVIDLIKDLGTRFLYGANSGKSEIHNSAHIIDIGLHSSAPGSSVHDGPEIEPDSSSEHRQDKEQGGKDSSANSTPQASEAHITAENGQSDLRGKTQVPTSNQDEVASGLVKTIPDDLELRSAENGLHSETDASGQENNNNPEDGNQPVPGDKNEKTQPSLPTTVDVRSEALSEPQEDIESHADNGGLSQEDIAHAFVNGVAPSAGISNTLGASFSESTVPEDKEKSTSNAADAHDRNSSPSDSRDVHESAHAEHVDPLNTSPSLTEPSLSGDVPETIPAPENSQSDASVQSSSESVSESPFSPESSHFEPPAEASESEAPDHVGSIDNTGASVPQENNIADSQGIGSGDPDVSAPSLDGEETREEDVNERGGRCITNTQGVRHCD